jgi:predicted metal-dependent phosphoesterase TrpH
MNPLRTVDLHVHTTASDGAFPAGEVARLARAAGLEAIAITDHDSVAAFADPSGEDGVEIIPGVELSAYFEAREVHILGYFVDPEDVPLRATLKSLQQKRRARAYSILRMLAARNINITPQEVFEIASGSSVSRLHVAELLIEGGHSANLYEAFRDFLGPEGAAFVPKPIFTVEQAIEIAHCAGGVAVLAHPRGNFTFDQVAMFAERGLDGIEAHYPNHSPLEEKECIEVAARLGLVATGGSDFHGRRYLDTPIGAARTDPESVERLFERSRPNGVRRLS